MSQDELEKFVIEEYLSYGDEFSSMLSTQIQSTKVESRKYTEIGFFTSYVVKNVKNSKKSKVYDGLSINFKNSRDILCFRLYIENGSISCLEGYMINGTDRKYCTSELDVSTIEGGGKSAFLID